MLDPVSALAFEMHASKGVFALLLGSGISRAAKIPTGWEVTLDLVRKVAALSGSSGVVDPAAWYVDTFGKAPDYSELLDKLATTPALRQGVIEPYLVPSAEEQARGEKTPTRAHRAIATLMVKGVVRVAVTTNFDRLLEQALSDLGVNPTVISSADHVAGAVPLVHAGPTIIKVHGDYLDTRIRNTSGELSSYEPSLDRLLDRVFDEFGLVVCGWSADWDVALKAAIDRAPARRYPMYWTSRGDPSSAAAALIARRAARLTPIADADSFFDELGEKISALEALSRPHPLSAEIAVAMLKEYLSEQRHAVRLHDLVTAEANQVATAIESSEFQCNRFSDEIFVRQIEAYVASVSRILPLAYVAGRWSDEKQAAQWVDVVTDLARRPEVGGDTVLLDLRLLPASLVLYAFGLGAITGQRPGNLGLMAGCAIDFGRLGKRALTDRLNICSLLARGGQDRFKLLSAYRTSALPGSDFVTGILRPITRTDLRSDLAFERALAKLELSLSFGYAERVLGDRSSEWMLPGRFLFHVDVAQSIVEAWKGDFDVSGEASELCTLADLAKSPQFEDMDRHVATSGLAY